MENFGQFKASIILKQIYPLSDNTGIFFVLSILQKFFLYIYNKKNAI